MSCAVLKVEFRQAKLRTGPPQAEGDALMLPRQIAWKKRRAAKEGKTVRGLLGSWCNNDATSGIIYRVSFAKSRRDLSAIASYIETKF